MATIVIGCDNAAISLKNFLKSYIKDHNFAVEDLGCNDISDKTFYPIIAKKVCEAIINSNYTKRGILLCGTGIGMCITANKFPGIRAAVCHDAYSAERAILSNNSNIICLGERVVGPELAKKILKEWLDLKFMDGPSTSKINEISSIEKENFKHFR